MQQKIVGRKVAAIDKEAPMAFARVVEFDGVSSGRVAEMKREIGRASCRERVFGYV